MLGFDETFLKNILAHLIYDTRVLKAMVGRIGESLWSSDEQWLVFQCVRECFERYGQAPGPLLGQALREHYARYQTPAAVQETVNALVGDLYDTPPAEASLLLAKLDEVLRSLEIQEALVQAREFYQAGEYQKVADIIQAAVRRGAGALARYHRSDYLATLGQRMARRAEWGDGGVALLIPDLDRGIQTLPGKKELCVWMAPKGYGKTWALVHTALASVQQRQRVLIVTLETGLQRYEARLDMALSGGSARTLSQTIRRWQDRFPGALQIVEMPSAGVKVRDVDAVLGEYLAGGFRPDVLVLDYMDLLDPGRRVSDDYEGQGRVSQELRGLAVERDLLCWSATQGNRKSREVEVIKLQHKADSIKAMFAVDLAISFTRTEEEKEAGIMWAFVMARREGRDGFQVHFGSDFERGQFYSASHTDRLRRDRKLPGEPLTCDGVSVAPNGHGRAVPGGGER